MDWAEIFGVVLLVICSNFTCIGSRALSTVLLLGQNTVSVSFSSMFVEDVFLAMTVTCLGNFVHLKVRSWLRRLETPFLEEINIGFGTRSLVGLVLDDVNSLQSFKSSHDVGS